MSEDLENFCFMQHQESIENHFHSQENQSSTGREYNQELCLNQSM